MVSIVRLKLELMDLFQLVLIVAVMAMVPSDSAAPSGTVMLHLPSESLMVMEAPSAKSSTVPPASVPVKVGVVSLVRLSTQSCRCLRQNWFRAGRC